MPYTAPSSASRFREHSPRGAAPGIRWQAARIFHETPSRAATSRYTNSALASGFRAEASRAFLTAGGSSGWYRGAVVRALTLGPLRLAGFLAVVLLVAGALAVAPCCAAISCVAVWSGPARWA